MGQVVPRRFFCGPCKKERWPGDCEHARTVSGLGGLSLLQQQLVYDDVCRACGESPRGCNCPAEARRKTGDAANAMALRVLALSGCSCKHHVTAYLADDVNGTITCGTCCSGITAGKGLTFSTGEVVAEDKIDNTSRRPVGLHLLEKAIAFGLETDQDRKLVYDPRMPGWISNGHFIAYAGDATAERLLKEHPSYSCKVYDQFKEWEASGRGLQVFWAGVRCEPEEAPVSMIGWGKAAWTSNEKDGKYQDAVSIVAPAYSDVVCSGGTCRERDRDNDPLAMLVRWERALISAVVMPRRETIIR